MSDFNDSTASTESAAPMDSTVDVTASASGAGATPQTVTDSTVDANASASADGQLSAGWSLEDEPEAEQSLIPEDDSDLPETLQGIDQQRVEGLVNALRSARREAREQSKAAKSAAQLQQQLEQYGGYEGVQQVVGFVNTLFEPTDEQGQPLAEPSTVPFLNQLWQASQERYTRLVTDVVSTHPNEVIQMLQQAGKLPTELSPQPGAGQIDDEVYQALPQHLKDIYRNLPPSLREEYDLMKDEARNAILQEKYELHQVREAQQQAQQQQWQEKYQAAQTEGIQAADNLVRQYEQAHYQALTKWQPFGPDHEQGNQRVYRAAVEGAFSETLSNPENARLYSAAQQMLREAPLLRLQGENARADQYVRRANEIARTFNARLGQNLRNFIKEQDQVYRDARAWRELQRQQNPQRTEIPGQGAASSARSNGTSALNEKGELSSDFKRRLAESLNWS